MLKAHQLKNQLHKAFSDPSYIFAVGLSQIFYNSTIFETVLG